MGRFTQQSDLKLCTTTLMSNENNVSETEDKKTTLKRKLAHMPFGYPGFSFIVFSHGLITSISNILEHISHRPLPHLAYQVWISGWKNGVPKRCERYIPTKSSSHAMSNNFFSILIDARRVYEECMKHT